MYVDGNNQIFFPVTTDEDVVYTCEPAGRFMVDAVCGFLSKDVYEDMFW